MIKGELEKNKKNADYFYGWGGRCYVFDDEGGKFDAYRQQKVKTKSLDLDYGILKSMNCQYIISSIQIEYQDENLDLQTAFENNIWKLYLYKVI